MDLAELKSLALIGMTTALSMNVSEYPLNADSSNQQEIKEQVICRAEDCSLFCQGGEVQRPAKPKNT